MAKTSSNDGSVSVCARREYAPVHYHWFRADERESLIAEIRRHARRADLSDRDIDRVVGEVRARLLALVEGRLVPVAHIKGPMESVTDVDVFEIRAGVDLGDDDRFLVRIYHVEPSVLRRKPGPTVVGVHLHAKDVSDEKQIRQKQDAELQQARRRFHEGRSASWGGATLLPIDSPA